MTHGVVFGRFMPLHGGHIALVRTARALVDHLTIVVCWQPDDEVPGAVRVQWMLEMFPSLRVVAHCMPSPHSILPSPDHLGAFAAQMQEIHPEPVDRLFASDARQEPLAVALGARFVLLDPDHAGVPVRSADVRTDPLASWPFIPPVVRSAYASTICLHGPESTGKTTLTRRLAEHFGTLYVPEYGRTYCEQYGLDLTMDDLVTIGRTHCAMTAALVRLCRQRLFLDTDPLMTAVWADMLFQQRDPWFERFDTTAKLYLLLDIDMPWIDDGTRFFGDRDRRRQFFDLSRAELERRGVVYRVIRGTFEERFENALAAIEEAGL
ncbi:AAA family ATPase [Sphingomonas sp.]|uniref:AAA family ATPase n=1 Tax=Sphingomonas sp. TaxID=28214 RepID=UPI003B3B6F2C